MLTASSSISLMWEKSCSIFEVSTFPSELRNWPISIARTAWDGAVRISEYQNVVSESNKALSSHNAYRVREYVAGTHLDHSHTPYSTAS